MDIVIGLLIIFIVIPFVGATLSALWKTWKAHREYKRARWRASYPDEPNDWVDDSVGSSDAAYFRGFAYTDGGRFDEAVKEFQEAIRLEPNHAGAHDNLGFVYQKQGKLDQAISGHKEALRIAPDFAMAYHNLGVAYKAQGRFKEAVECFETFLTFLELAPPEYASGVKQIEDTIQELKEKLGNENEEETIKLMIPERNRSLVIESLKEADSTLLRVFKEEWDSFPRSKSGSGKRQFRVVSLSKDAGWELQEAVGKLWDKAAGDASGESTGAMMAVGRGYSSKEQVEQFKKEIRKAMERETRLMLLHDFITQQLINSGEEGEGKTRK